jgi:hypothetical protein
VTGRRRIWTANWSAIWYLLSAFAVISYTENAIFYELGIRHALRKIALGYNEDGSPSLTDDRGIP